MSGCLVWGSVVTYPDGHILRRVQPMSSPREDLLDLLKQRVMAHEAQRLADNRVVRARERVEELETEQREAWNHSRVIQVQIDDAADELFLPEAL